MKKNLSVILLLAATLIASLSVSCRGLDIRGNGKIARGEFRVGENYSRLSVSNAIVVQLVEANGGYGTIECDEEVMEYISIEEKNGTVEIGYTPWANIRLRSGIETRVTIPVSRALTGLKASSASKIVGDVPLVCGELDMDVSSAAKVNLVIAAQEVSLDASSAADFDGSVSAENLKVDLSSAANCNMAGTASNLDVDVSSAAHFRGYDLESKSAGIEASSAGSVEITVTEMLNARASSGASVRYKGAPGTVLRDTSSGGSVTAN